VIDHSMATICRSMGGGKLISFTSEFLILKSMISSFPGSIYMVCYPLPLNGFLRI